MSTAVEVKLVRVVISDRRHQQTIHLRERDGERQFSILIGINEAEEIHRKLRGYKPTRPMTHDLIVQLLTVCGGHIDRVVVSDLRGGTFIANIVIRIGDREESIDARPSDAIALAVQVEVPIYVEKRVFDALDRGE